MFYPINWQFWQDIFIHENTLAVLPRETYALHLWNHILNVSQFDKTKPFGANTLIGHLFAKYCSDYNN